LIVKAQQLWKFKGLFRLWLFFVILDFFFRVGIGVAGIALGLPATNLVMNVLHFVFLILFIVLIGLVGVRICENGIYCAGSLIPFKNIKSVQRSSEDKDILVVDFERKGMTIFLSRKFRIRVHDQYSMELNYLMQRKAPWAIITP